MNTTTTPRLRRWEHDEGMDYRVAVTEAVQLLSKRIDDVSKPRYALVEYAHPGSIAVVQVRFQDVETVALTYSSPDWYGARMTAYLHKVDPHTVAEMIISMLDHGRPVN